MGFREIYIITKTAPVSGEVLVVRPFDQAENAAAFALELVREMGEQCPFSAEHVTSMLQDGQATRNVLVYQPCRVEFHRAEMLDSVQDEWREEYD